MSIYKKIISQFDKKNILVVGDIILDRYIQGSVTRISPEAPVPIVLEEKSFYTTGGAANVSQNLSSLGANVTQVGRIGNDFEGKLLKRELKRKNIDVSGVFLDKNIPTITKTRIIAQHQQIVRIDRENIKESKDRSILIKILNFIEKRIDNFDAIIISDYGKGLITPEVIDSLCSLALTYNKIITVDPKVENFGFYKKVTAITPNKNEAENAIRNIKITHERGSSLGINIDRLDKDADIDKAGEKLLEFLDLECLLITLGERGMRLFEKGKKTPYSITTKAQEVFDVTGAGDAVISVFTLCLASNATKRQAAELSNIAAGIVVGKMGAVAVSKEELLEAIK